MTAKIFSVLVLVAIFAAIPLAESSAQQLRLPNLLPFRKRSNEVTPIQLSDQNRNPLASQGQSVQQSTVFNFLNPQANAGAMPAGKAGPLAEFNERSRRFFSNAGKGISRFADDTKQALVDGWTPPRTNTAWWNEGPKPLSGQPLFNWSQNRQADPLPPLSRPRTARQYQNGDPRHRF